MPFIRDCLMLLLTPSGRASHMPYVVGGVIVRVVAGWASYHVFNAEEGDPSGIYAFFALASVWMWFCLCSRRLHDSGSSNMIMIPLLIAEVCILLSVLDTSWIEQSEDPLGTAATIYGADRLVHLIAWGLGSYLLKAESQSGDNAFGAPFGEHANGGWRTSQTPNLQTTHSAVGASRIARLDAGDRMKTQRTESTGGGLPRRAQQSAPRKGFGKR